MSWPCDVIARFGVWLRTKQVDSIFHDAEAKFMPSASIAPAGIDALISEIRATKPAAPLQSETRAASPSRFF